jgi:hypothetical protein
VLISGSDAGWTAAGVEVAVVAAVDGADSAGVEVAGADVAGEEVASVGAGVAADPLAAVAFPPGDGVELGAEVLLGAVAAPVLAFGAGVAVVGGFAALAAGGCAAAPGEFGAEEFPGAAAPAAGAGVFGAAALPWAAFAGGGVVCPDFFSSDGR